MKKMKTDDGGPVFPVAENSEIYVTRLIPGMSLRDYFAAAALQGLLASERGSISSSGLTKDRLLIVSIAYVLADAMLAKRGAVE